jgi:acyl transferase domain-containing protein
MTSQSAPNPSLSTSERVLLALKEARSKLEKIEQEKQEQIAIIGMSGQFPGASTVDQLWQNLCNGVNAIQLLSQVELVAAGVTPEVSKQSNYVSAHASFEDIAGFDAAFFGYAPREAELLDPQHRIFLECAWSALEDAGYDPERYPGAIAVYGGTALNSYLVNLYSHPQLRQSVDRVQAVISNVMGLMPTRVSYKLNLRGPSCGIQTGCSTSLVSVHVACQSLLSRECDIALAGGVAIDTASQPGYMYQNDGVMSPDGYCRAFDADAQGTVFGNGVGIVVLKRLSAAIADRDHIYAVIKASAINNDGSQKVGLTAPSVSGQASVIAAAIAKANINPETIQYIETHGTGTTLGDPIEIAALTKAFQQQTQKLQFCAIGSIKTNLGHLDAAAGVTGLIKTALALKHQQLPPTLHFNHPNPQINFNNSPFFVNTELTPWQDQDCPRRAAVSSFGMGGTNAHVILESAPEPQVQPTSSPQLLLLSAKTPTALKSAIAQLLQHLQHHPNQSLADIAYTLQVGRQAFEHRYTLTCTTATQAIQALTNTLDTFATANHQLTFTQSRQITFLFPGQSSLSIHMVQDLYATIPTFQKTIDYCSTLLNFNLSTLLAPTTPTFPANLTQPLLFSLEYALAQLLISWNIQPHALLGDGIGEYVAACLAGVFSLEDALKLVAERGTEAATPDYRSILEQLTLNAPQLPLISSATGTWMTAEQSQAPDYWIQQLQQTMPRTTGFNTIAQQSDTILLEVGLGNTLSTAAQQMLSPEFLILNTMNQSQDGISAPEFLLNTVGQLWQTGLEINWSQLHVLEHRYRVPLPTYPFEHQRYWVDLHTVDQNTTQTENQTSLSKQEDMKDWFSVPSWKRIPVSQQPLEADQCWLIFTDTSDVGAALVQKLEQANQKIILVKRGDRFQQCPQHYVINPSSFSDYQQLLDSLTSQQPQQIIHLWGLEDSNADLDISNTYPSFSSLIALAQMLKDTTHITVVTQTIHQITGAETLNSLQSLALAACKVIPQEYPNIHCCSIDLDSSASEPSRLATQIYQEIAHQQTNREIDSTSVSRQSDHLEESVVAYRDRHRWVQTFEPLAISGDYPQELIKQGGTYLITGDLVEGLGLMFAQQLAKHQTKLILIGRLGLPQASEWDAWLATHGQQDSVSQCIRVMQGLMATGTDLRFFSVDLTDADRMQETIDQVYQTVDTIHGVIHAGTMGDRSSCLIQALTPDEIAHQLQSKVQGLIILDRALQDRVSDFYLLQSSLSTVVGGIGFAAYAAANCFMDAYATYAAQRSTSQVPWISVNWDACRWDDAPANTATGQTLVDLALLPKEVGEVTERILSRPDCTQIIVSPVELSLRRKQPHPAQLSSDSSQYARPTLSTDYVPPQTETETAIAQIMQDLLGIERVGIHDNFFELGGHSLLAIQAVSKLRETFQVELPMRDFLFEAPTIAGIAKIIVDSQTQSIAQGGHHQAIADLLDQVEQMDLSPDPSPPNPDGLARIAT